MTAPRVTVSSLVTTAFLMMGAIPAWSAPVTGRITYIDPTARQIILDGSASFSVASGVDMSTLSVAELVDVNVNGNTVTAARKMD